MKVLVYGHWPDRTQNILPFFTASYSEQEKVDVTKHDLRNKIRLIFVGALTENKNPEVPLLTLKVLWRKGIDAHITFCGDGPLKSKLEKLADTSNIKDRVALLGNVTATRVKKELQQAHFLVFVSRSEGWPKAVAEAMFWGCLPLSSPVSCVPEMLEHGKRGDLVPPDPLFIAERIIYYWRHPDEYLRKSQLAKAWARQYTLERFEQEIVKLLYS